MKRHGEQGRLGNRRGQGLVEYLILVALIAVAAIAVVGVVGRNLREQYANVSNAITGKGQRVTPTTLRGAEHQARGMADFAEGASSARSGAFGW